MLAVQFSPTTKLYSNLQTSSTSPMLTLPVPQTPSRKLQVCTENYMAVARVLVLVFYQQQLENQCSEIKRNDMIITTLGSLNELSTQQSQHQVLEFKFYAALSITFQLTQLPSSSTWPSNTPTTPNFPASNSPTPVSD